MRYALPRLWRDYTGSGSSRWRLNLLFAKCSVIKVLVLEANVVSKPGLIDLLQGK